MNVIDLIVVGRGNVGGALLRQIAGAEDRLRARNAGIRIVGIVDAASALFDGAGIPAGTVMDIADGRLALRDAQGAVAGSGDSVSGLTARGTVVADVSASPRAAAWHAAWLRAGLHVATANKKALTGTLAEFDAIMAASAAVDGPQYRYETACGAGLPVIGPLRDLVTSGDEVLSVRGAVSGTLGFIFSRCQRGVRFADAVRQAKEQGYTEPDPRDDLNGMDVARKALILARLMGRRLELSDIAVHDLVPEPLREVSRDEFLARSASIGGDTDARAAEAGARGACLRYLAAVDASGARVGIEEVPLASPFGALDGPENLFVIRTRRYDRTPLVIRGPGAGPEVTAAGVFADIARIAGF